MRVYADRVGEITTTVGNGNFALGGNVEGFQVFSGVCAVGDTFDYSAFAVDANGIPTGDWETGTGTFANGDTIARAVQQSSNANNLVNFAAGNKIILMSENAASIKALAAGGGGSSNPWYFNPPKVADFPDVINNPVLADDPQTGLQISHVGSNAAPNVIGRAIPNPGDNWSAAIHFLGGVFADGYGNIGLTTYGADKTHFYHLAIDSRIWLHFYRETQAGFDNYETHLSLVSQPSWLRYRYTVADGNLHCDASWDGKLWAQDIFVTQVTGSLGGNPASIGLVVGTESTNYPAMMTVDNFTFVQ